MHAHDPPDDDAWPVHTFGAAPDATERAGIDWDVLHFQINQAAERFESRLQSQTDALLRDQLGARVQALRVEMDAAARAAADANRTLVDSRHALARDLRVLTWKTLGVTVAACALLVAGSTWIAWENARTARASRLDARTAALLNQVRIGDCGGRACVRIDQRAKRWGDKGEYVLLER